MGKWKNIILGEKMPDKDDPKYREKYEKDVEAGRRFARVTRIDRLAGHVQRFAERHRGVFLGIVIAIVAGCLAVNIVHFVQAVRLHRAQEAYLTQPDSLPIRRTGESYGMPDIRSLEE